MAHSRRNSVDSRRKYVPPPSCGGPKDDLHEWSIYRQNLTSTIAESLLSGLAPHPNGACSARSSTRGRQPDSINLPYGDFQMHDNAVESVLNGRRGRDPYLSDKKGQVYLRFGLPRVTLSNEQDSHTTTGPRGLNYKNRKSHSELDVRRAVLEAPATRGPYHIKSGSTGLLNSISMQPLQRPSFEYAQSEISLNRPAAAPTPVPTAFRASQRSVRSHLRVPLSVALPGLAIDVPSTSGFPSAAHFSGVPKMGSRGNNFVHGKRHHHGHYFSNLDLFTSSAAYNYLHYAKADDLHGPVGKHPHLQLRHVSFDVDQRTMVNIATLREPKYRRILDDVSMELFGGETMAIMYTAKAEVTTLLSLLADRHHVKGRMDGTVFLNGIPMSGQSLGDRIGYVCDHDLHPLLTVKEHLRLQAAFVKPATQLFPASSMVDSLMETLALSPFNDRLICDLGRTEHQRTKIACQIMLDTDILLLDDVFNDMDLYDMTFLIDYLRDWASKLNRIVITAINPPTFELLSMYHKTTLLASGRIIYSGASGSMINYFEALNYPCPLFKNPCDYYVDLVTHDHLTVEVAMESSERIRRLSEYWTQRALPLSEPNPGGLAPPRFRNCNPFSATFWIYYRFCLLLTNRPWQYAQECVYCLLMSIIAGAIFYHLPTAQQAGVNDRFGLFYTILTLFHIPNLMLNIERIHSERLMVFNDSIHNLYPAVSYLAAKLCFEIPLAAVVYGLYSIPVYVLAQLQHWSNDGGRAFGVYVGLTISYCFATRMLAWTAAYLFNEEVTAAIFTGVFITFFSLTSGVTLHPNDQWSIFGDWSRYISPTPWLVQIFSEHELLGNSTGASWPLRQNGRSQSTMLEFGCEAREIKFGPIVATGPCPISNGLEALRFANLTVRGLSSAQNATYYIGAAVIAGIALLCIAVACFAISMCSYEPRLKQRRREH